MCLLPSHLLLTPLPGVALSQSHHPTQDKQVRASGSASRSDVGTLHAIPGLMHCYIHRHILSTPRQGLLIKCAEVMTF